MTSDKYQCLIDAIGDSGITLSPPAPGAEASELHSRHTPSGTEEAHYIYDAVDGFKYDIAASRIPASVNGDGSQKPGNSYYDISQTGPGDTALEKYKNLKRTTHIAHASTDDTEEQRRSFLAHPPPEIVAERTEKIFRCLDLKAF